MKLKKIWKLWKMHNSKNAVMEKLLLSTCVVAFVLIFSPLLLSASDCWIVSNIKGYAAYADHEYKFQNDGLPNMVLICFTEDGGTVTGSDVKFIKFGNSTLAGYGGNEKGNEMFEVYQIDRAKRKLLYTKCRIGTKTVTPILSDVVCSYVGDAIEYGK